MNRHLKHALAVASLAVAGAAFAAGSLPNLLAQASTPETDPAKSQAAPAGDASKAPSTSSTGNTPPMPAPPQPDAASGATRAQADSVFDQLDTNKDGVLSRDEFARATIRSQ